MRQGGFQIVKENKGEMTIHINEIPNIQELFPWILHFIHLKQLGVIQN